MITSSTLYGHAALWLENESLKLAILPEKGADVPDLIHKPSGVQFLMQTPGGLHPAPVQPVTDFLENYEGGWQELFPNANEACVVHGANIPFHGEVALLPWEYEIEPGDVLHLWVTCRQTPFRLDRWMHLEGDALIVRGTVTSLADQVREFIWGQHIVLGGDFLEDGCRLEIPAARLATPTVAYELATARLADDQQENWPMARGRQPGQWIDLRHVPGPQAHSHDDVYVTGLERGHLDVTNPRLRLQFNLDWDADIYPWVIVWQPYGGADLPPLTGIYGLGIEPWVSRYNLTGAIAAGQAKTLGPGKSLTTELRVSISQI